MAKHVKKIPVRKKAAGKKPARKKIAIKKPAIDKKFASILAVVLGALVVLTIVLFATGVLKLQPTTADITSFNIGDSFDCRVNRDYVAHDDETDTDYFVAYFSANYYGPEVNREVEEQNTTGYDENTPTADQLSEEEQEQLSNEEIERVNEKTINEFNKRLAKKRTAGEFVEVAGLQDNYILEEPNNLVRSGAGNDDNASSLHKGAASGDTYEFYVIYTLQNFDPVTVVFLPNTEGNDDIIEITFDISKHFKFSSILRNFEEGIEVAQKQAVKTVEFKAADINLVDGWYADSEAVSLVRLKNPKFGDATLDFNYSSSVTPQRLAQETAA